MMAETVSHDCRCACVPTKGKRRRSVLWLLLVALAVTAGLVVLLWPRPERLYKVTVLPSLGGRFTLPFAINERGQVAGYSEVAKGRYHLFLWDRQTGMRDLGPADSSFMDLNDAGQIVGTVEDANGVEQAFLWDPNTAGRLLAMPGATTSRAHAINNRGWVVGSYKTADTTSHAFVWDRARGIRELGTPEDGYRGACDINDAGQVVAFVKGGTLIVQLDDEGTVIGHTRSPLTVSLAVINNHGAVGGWSETRNGEYEAVVWHPDSDRKSVRLVAEGVGLPHLNDIGQLCVGEEWHSRFKLLGRTLWRRRHNRSYLSDPRRGTITLNEYVSLGRDEALWTTDLNNKGCLVGAVQSEKRGTSRGVLLEPIPERWEE